MIKIAIQSKGRLNEDTTQLLADAGITVGAGHRQLISRAKGFDMGTAVRNSVLTNIGLLMYFCV